MSDLFSSPKHPSATITLTFGFGSALAQGDSIATVNPVTVEVIAGTDDNPSAILLGSATKSGTDVLQNVTGGVAGVRYRLQSTVVTALGFTQIVSGVLRVEDPAGYPAEFALTDLSTLKAWMDPPITGTTFDATLLGLIDRVSHVLIEELPNVAIGRQTFTEKRNGNGGDTLMLRRWPLLSVASVTINGATIREATTHLDSGWIVDEAMNLVVLRGYTFDRGTKNVEIGYQAGLISGDRKLGALEQAALVSCISWWKRRKEINQQSVSLGGVGQSISFSQRDIPSEARMILDRIRFEGVVLE